MRVGSQRHRSHAHKPIHNNNNAHPQVHRGSTEFIDLFVAHIGAMDTFARALRIVDQAAKDGALERWVDARYASYGTGIGAKIEAGEVGFEELAAYAAAAGDTAVATSMQERFEQGLNYYS